MKNPEVFKGKHFQDILKEIHGHSASKRSAIKTLMDSLSGLVKTPGDAAIVVPVIRDLIDVAVKNDEHLIKIAVIIQRLMAAEHNAGGGGSLESVLSQADRDALLEEVAKAKEELGKEALDDLRSSIEEDKEVAALAEKVEAVQTKIEKSD